MEELGKNQGNLVANSISIGRTLILGLGRSGRAVGHFLEKRQCPFAIYDDAGLEKNAGLLQEWSYARWFSGAASDVLPFDMIIVSPGVPLAHSIVRSAVHQTIPVISELEFASRLTKRPIVAITGTNGKSTTTALVAHFLNAAGHRAVACGNFGIPLLEVVEAKEPWDIFVAEVSSFQGEASPTFKPRYGALLNLTPDHLDRYPAMSDYLGAKEKIVINQTEDDVLVYNAEEPAFLNGCVRTSRARRWPFSSAKSLERGAFFDRDRVVLRLENSEETISLAKNPLVGLHHVENILAATLLARLMGVSAVAIEQALPAFKGLPHRLEKVREVGGVCFYDDSKATNVGALAMSLASFDEKVILIAGGRDKNGDFGALAPLVRAKVAEVMLIGEAAATIAKAWEGGVALCEVGTMARAVETAFARARTLRCPVVLAPACASFDQFRNYHHRGEVFQELVRELS